MSTTNTVDLKHIQESIHIAEDASERMYEAVVNAQDTELDIRYSEFCRTLREMKRRLERLCKEEAQIAGIPPA